MKSDDSKSFSLPPYRILDLTDERGAYCTKILADFGADVVYYSGV